MGGNFICKGGRGISPRSRMFGYYSIQNAQRIAAAFHQQAAPDAVFGIYPGNELVKFPENHFVCENENCITACCGYALNDRDLIRSSGSKDLSDYLSKAAAQNTPLSGALHGAYLAAVYNKATRRLTLTNDLLKKQPLYYYTDGTDLLFSTSFFELADACKRLGKALTPDAMAVSMMVKTGALWEDFTFAEEIRYLRPFHELHAGPDGVLETALPYPVLNRSANPDEAVERIDALFSDAVRLQYEKNAAAGYGQLGSLSGGMDSRCVLVRAEQLGFTDDLTFTYAESGSLDMTISQQVARHYQLPHLFFSMDNGGFLADRDQYVLGNEGQILYCGSTGVLKVISSLDTTGFGIVHSGISGGEIFGDIIPAEGDDPEGMVHLDKLLTLLACPDETRAERLKKLAEEYPTFNTFRQLSDIRTNTNFMRTVSPLVHVASPYLYEPLYAYLMTLPIAMKGFRKLYYRFVAKHLSLPYRTTDASLPRTTGTLAERYVRQELRNIQKSFGGKTRYDMNPFDLWMQENPLLQSFTENTYRADMAALSGLDIKLLTYMQAAFPVQRARDKFCTLTATWALKKLIG